MIRIKKENITRTVTEHEYNTRWKPLGFERIGAAKQLGSVPAPQAPVEQPPVVEPPVEPAPELDRQALLEKLHALGGSVHHNAGIPRILDAIAALEQQ